MAQELVRRVGRAIVLCPAFICLPTTRGSGCFDTTLLRHLPPCPAVAPERPDVTILHAVVTVFRRGVSCQACLPLRAADTRAECGGSKPIQDQVRFDRCELRALEKNQSGSAPFQVTAPLWSLCC